MHAPVPHKCHSRGGDSRSPLHGHARSLLSGLRPVFIAVFALGLLAATPSLRAEDQVIYPRSAPPAGLPAGREAPGSSLLLPFLAVAAAAAGGWLLWRQRRMADGPSGAARKLSVTESRPLGNRQYLVVADYDGRKYLLGVCPGRIDMLAPLEPEKK